MKQVSVYDSYFAKVKQFLNTTLLEMIFLNLIFNSLVESWKIGSFVKFWMCVGKCVFCKCANVRLAKIIFFTVRWENFLKQSGRSMCRQSQSTSFCQDVKVSFSEVYISEYGRSLGLLTTGVCAKTHFHISNI
jgi:hypothetical protein